MIETRVVPHVSRATQATFYQREFRYSFGKRINFGKPIAVTDWFPDGPLAPTRKLAETWAEWAFNRRRLQ